MSKDIKIGVAIPAYSRPELLKLLLDTIPSWVKVYISDNGSSLKGITLALNENTVLSHSEKLIPMFSNWNRAVSMALEECTYVLVPSDDDLYLPGAFEEMLHEISKSPETDIAIFGCDFVDEYGNVKKGYKPGARESFARGYGFLKFQYGVDARMPSILLKSEFLKIHGIFDEKFKLTAADSDLVQRALLLGTSIFVPSTVGLYRIWAGSLTHKKQATDEWMEEIDAWTAKIITILSSVDLALRNKINAKAYRDEIFAQNLLAGIAGLISRGDFGAARRFSMNYPTPVSARMRTKLALLKRRMIIMCNS